MKTFTLILITNIFFSISIVSQTYDKPYIDNNRNKDYTISKIEIQSNKTIVYVDFKNTSNSHTKKLTIPGTKTPNALYLYDMTNNKKYFQKFNFDYDLTKDEVFTIEPNNSLTLKLVFPKLDSNVKSFNFSGYNGSWDFVGIKLFSEQELIEYLQKIENEKKKQIENEKAEKIRKEQEEQIKKQEMEKKRLDKELKEEENRKAQEKALKDKLNDNTAKQTYTKIDYDGIYVEENNKFIYIKPSKTIWGRFGRCYGDIDDFNLIKTYFISSLENSIICNNQPTKIVIVGKQNVSNLNMLKLSELSDFSKDFGMCVWNLDLDIEHSFAGKKSAWTPKFVDKQLQQVFTKNKKTKTINENKVEVYISDTLEKGKFYVLYNLNNPNYYVFYIK